MAARQLAEGHLGDNYKGWHRVYTDGSVDPLLRMAAAAAVTGGEEERVAERLSFYSSSTTAELAALSLGLGLLERRAADPERVVFLCDSKAALGHLRNPDRAPGLAKSIVVRAGQLQRQGWDLAYQWLPAHCGILGNETADRMAAEALKGAGSQNPTVLPFEDARLLIRRTIALKHPELEIGPLPARVPDGISRQAAAVLHRLRTGSARTPAARAQWQQGKSGNCTSCNVLADAEHLLLHCAVYKEERSALQASYRRLGGDSGTLEPLLRPRLPRHSTDRALRALASFVVQTGRCDNI